MDRPILTEITNTRSSNELISACNENSSDSPSSTSHKTATSTSYDGENKSLMSQPAAPVKEYTETERLTTNPDASQTSQTNPVPSNQEINESKDRDLPEHDGDNLPSASNVSSEHTNSTSLQNYLAHESVRDDHTSSSQDHLCSPQENLESIADRTASSSSITDDRPATTPPSSTNLSPQSESFEIKHDQPTHQIKKLSPPPPSQRVPRSTPRCLKLAHGLKMRLQYAYYKVLTDQKQLSMDQLSPPDSWSIRTFSEATSHARKRHKKAT